MGKTTVDQLTAKEKETLANFYDTEAYRVLVKVHSIETVGLGKDALAAQDMLQVKWLGGKLQSLTDLLKTIKTLYDLSRKD